MNPELPAGAELSRRRFMAGSGLAAATLLAGGGAPLAAEAGTLRVGLVGCGGRGTGAAAQALAADKNVRLTAMGDIFPDRLEISLNTLQTQEVAAKVEVPPANRFTGFDAYKRVIEHSDVVLLATPPHFRPMHIAAAIAANRHVFAEKPVAVDAPGVREVLARCAEAREKRLSVVSGLCLRFAPGYREMVRRIREGAIGEIHTLQANDFRGPIWVKPRLPGQTEMEYQLRNWYYFTWLSGDFNVEQHVHMLDLCSWVMGDEYPASAIGVGGRQVRTGPDHGNIYDHHAVIYEYAGGARLFASCRQQAGCASEISATVRGSKGAAFFSHKGSWIEVGGKREPFEGERDNVYQLEHDALFESLRRGEPLNHGGYMSHSTLMAILGRMATYTGQKVTWGQAMESAEALLPSGYDWNAEPPPAEIAIPGVTKLA